MFMMNLNSRAIPKSMSNRHMLFFRSVFFSLVGDWVIVGALPPFIVACHSCWMYERMKSLECYCNGNPHLLVWNDVVALPTGPRAVTTLLGIEY